MLKLSSVVVELLIEKLVVVLELRGIGRGRLVGLLHIHLLELFTSGFLFEFLLLLHLLFLLLLLSIFGLPFFIFFAFLECLKNILVMQKSVGKLIFEIFVVQELRDSFLNQGHFEDLVDGGTLGRVLLQHNLNQLVNTSTETFWQFIELTLDNSLSKLMQGSGIERRAQGAHFIE